MSNSIENPPPPPPEYPQDWLVDDISQSFRTHAGCWRATAAEAHPVSEIYLHGVYLRRDPEEPHADFIARAIEWYGRIKREEDLRKIRIVWSAYSLADANYRQELNRVFPRGAWFEVKPFRRQKNPIAMQVSGYANGFNVKFQMPKKPKFGRVTRGYVRRTIPIPEIGRQVAPPQENP